MCWVVDIASSLEQANCYGSGRQAAMCALINLSKHFGSGQQLESLQLVMMEDVLKHVGAVD